MPICLEFVVSEVFMDWVITHSERTGYCEEKIEKLIGKFYDQKVIVIVKVAVTLCNNIYIEQLEPINYVLGEIFVQG